MAPIVKRFSLGAEGNVSTTTHSYVICGWLTLSEIPLTDMPSAPSGNERADVVIQIASGHSPISRSTDRFVFEHSAERSLIRIHGIADFEIKNGRQIRVWPAAAATQRDVEIFLLGPAWASLCHQRRLLPLHASAILTDRGIVAFAGHSGAGKSTTAALMSSLGFKLVTDDILPISFNRHAVPGAWPYLRRLKLQGGSIIALALTPSQPVSERLDRDKYFVRPTYVADDQWNRLDRIYLIETDSSNSPTPIDQITGAESVCALVDHTYLFNFIVSSGLFRNHLEFCTELASRVPIYRLRLSPSFCIGRELADFVRAHLEMPT